MPELIRGSSVGVFREYVTGDSFVDGRYGKALPQVVFAVLSFAAGIAALFLPETLNRFLPETIEQGKDFGKEDNDKKAVDKTEVINIKTISESTDIQYGTQ